MPKGRDFEASTKFCANAIELINGVVRLSPKGWGREEAVRIGLLLRIEHLIHSILCLRHCEGTGEARFALSRLVIESAMNLKYLVFKGGPEVYERFVKSGLRANVDLLEDLENSIGERIGIDEMPIEKRMKASAMQYLKDSGTTLEEVRASPKEWGPSYRERMREIGYDEAYLYIQSIPSSAVHGDWSSLLRFYLHKGDEGYSRRQLDPAETDNLLNPIVALTCDALVDYAEAVHPDNAALVRSARFLQETVMDAEEESGDFKLGDVQGDGDK